MVMGTGEAGGSKGFDSTPLDSSGHPVNNNDVLTREGADENLEFHLDPSVGLYSITVADLRHRFRELEAALYDATRLEMRMKERLTRLETALAGARAAAEAAPQNIRFRTEVEYLEEAVKYKKGLVRSAERVVALLNRLNEGNIR